MRGLLNQRVGIGRHMNQVFGTAERLLRLGMGRGRATLQPRNALSDHIRSETSVQHLELNPGQ